MRDAFVNAILARLEPGKSVFLTGDLGFMALEPVREHLGQFFINAGVAEQNMVSVAAGLAKTGLDAWVYSIAPFCYARPFEQVRNDVCLHRLPVRLVGNGGGYGYGVMGATHHALEDYGILLTLQGMRAYVPAFDSDLDPILARMSGSANPGYLRLGRCERPAGFALPEYEPWRRLLDGGGPVLVYVGPIVGGHLSQFLTMDPAERPEVWVVSELSLTDHPVPVDLLHRLANGAALWVVEEHVAHGSFGQALALHLLQQRANPAGFRHFAAQGYVSGRSGSQAFYRKESGIDASSVLECLTEHMLCHAW